jgi:predicted patatin/cPLA2 family phospholipase
MNGKLIYNIVLNSQIKLNTINQVRFAEIDLPGSKNGFIGNKANFQYSQRAFSQNEIQAIVDNTKLEDISYLSHPDLRLIQVLQMTCGIPVLITPVCIENKCFIDGGMSCNYPLNYCINKFTNIDEILGIKYKYDNDNENVYYNQINTQSTLLDFIMNFLFKILDNFNSTNNQSKIPNEIVCKASIMSISVLKSAIYSSEIRKNLIDCGIETTKEFIENLTKS